YRAEAPRINDGHGNTSLTQRRSGPQGQRQRDGRHPPPGGAPADFQGAPEGSLFLRGFTGSHGTHRPPTPRSKAPRPRPARVEAPPLPLRQILPNGGNDGRVDAGAARRAAVLQLPGRARLGGGGPERVVSATIQYSPLVVIENSPPPSPEEDEECGQKMRAQVPRACRGGGPVRPSIPPPPPPPRPPPPGAPPANGKATSPRPPGGRGRGGADARDFRRRGRA